MRKRLPWGVLALYWALVPATGCAPLAPPKHAQAETPAARVSFVLVDGLNEELLDRYLATPEARGSDRFLRRALGIPEDHRIAESTRVLRLAASAELPGLAAVNAASATTGLAPARHRVRAEGSVPAAGVLTLAEHARAARYLAVDHGSAAGQTPSDSEQTDAVISELDRLPQAPALFTVRFRSLGDALANGGDQAGVVALGAIDKQLGEIASRPNSPFGPEAFMFLASTAGSKRTSESGLIYACSAITERMGVAPAQCLPLGGMALLTGAAFSDLAKITSVSGFNGTIYVRTRESVSVLDAGLQGLRSQASSKSATGA